MKTVILVAIVAIMMSCTKQDTTPYAEAIVLSKGVRVEPTKYWLILGHNDKTKTRWCTIGEFKHYKIGDTITVSSQGFN